MDEPGDEAPQEELLAREDHLLDVVVRERAPVIELLAREGQCRRQRRRDELSPDRPEELSEDR